MIDGITRLGLVWVLSLLAGCTQLPASFRCTDDQSCVLDGRNGHCEMATLACSFDDITCMSLKRYHNSAGMHANECVDDSDAGTGDLGVGDFRSPLTDMAGVLDGPALQGCALHPTAFGCDDFEAGKRAMWGTNWADSVSTNATAEIQSSVVHWGSNAMHIVTTAGNPNTLGGLGYTLQMKNPPVPAGNDLWVRAFIRTDRTTVGDVGLVGLTRDFNGTSVGYGFHQDNHLYQFSNLAVKPYIYNYSPDQTLPNNTWKCFEWHVVMTSTGSMTPYYDGATVPKANITGNCADAYSAFTLGFNYSMATNVTVAVTNVYIDDIVIDTQRIGCNP